MGKNFFPKNKIYESGWNSFLVPSSVRPLTFLFFVSGISSTWSKRESRYSHTLHKKVQRLPDSHSGFQKIFNRRF